MRFDEFSNDYQQKFQEEAEKNGLINDLAMLYTIEKASGNLKIAGAIMALIPGIDRFEALFQRVQDIHEDSFRVSFSEKCLATLMKIQPVQFVSWRDAKDFDVFLHSQDGSMFAVKQRESFLNFRQQIRIEWTQKVASDGEIRQEKMMSELLAEQEKLEIFQNTMYGLMHKSHEAESKASTKLDLIADEQINRFTHLTEAMAKVESLLSTQGIAIDKQTYLLLQSDADLSSQISLVAHYLIEQNDLKQRQADERRHQELRIENYQGLIDGFGLLSIIGQRTNNSTLTKISGVCSQTLLIHKAFSELAKMTSFAALSPYAAIGMAVLNIFSLFMKQGPDSHQVILKQLEQLSKQIESMHRDMKDRFVNLGHYLNHLEHVIIRSFKQINYLITKPVIRSIEEIHSELNQLSYLVQLGFQDLYIKDLSDCVAHINSFIEGITPKISADKPQEWLVQLAHWVKDKAYNRQLTSVAVFSENKGLQCLSVPPKKMFSILQKAHPDFRSFINIFFIISVQQSWTTAELSAVPHTGIWLHSLSIYLKLREYSQTKFPMEYDPQFKEIQQIYSQTTRNIASLNELLNEKSIIEGCFKKITALYKAQLEQFKSIQSANLNNFDCGKLIKYNIPQNFSFEYVKGKNVYKRKGHQRSFTIENGFTEQNVLQLIGETAKNGHIPLFDKTFLLAEKMGLIEFHCIMHRSMSDDRKRIYQTEGKAYGLEITLYIRETQEKFLLTRATPGYAKWTHSGRHDTTKTIDWHKYALPKKTQLDSVNIQLALAKVQHVLDLRIKEQNEPFYQKIAHELQHEWSIANELLQYLQLGKMLHRFTCFGYQDFDYQQAIDQICNLLKACNENLLASESPINKFFQDLPNKIEQLITFQPKLTLNNSALEPLQDLLQGRLILQQFLQSRVGIFGNHTIPTVGLPYSSKGKEFLFLGN